MLQFAIYALLTLAVAGFGLYILFPAAFKPSPGGGRKRWAYLFTVVLTVEGLVVVLAPALNWWLPKSASSYSGGIDDLFYVILAVTGITYIGVSLVFCYALFKFPHEDGRKSLYTHGNHKLEMIWSAVPAVLLILLGFGQIPAWLNVKSTSWLSAAEESNKQFLQVEVVARQWEWRIRYASSKHMEEWADRPAAMKDIRMKMPPRADDVRLVNEVHCIKGQKTLVHLKTQDVIHSFFLPQMRLKQDALPGKTIPVWYEPIEANCHRDGDKWQDGVRAEYSPARLFAAPRSGSANQGKEIPEQLKSQLAALKESKTYNEQEWNEALAKALSEADLKQYGETISDAARTYVSDHKYIWELACAEYCGSRHSLMRGKVYVHESRKDFDAWLKSAEAAQRATSEK